MQTTIFEIINLDSEKNENKLQNDVSNQETECNNLEIESNLVNFLEFKRKQEYLKILENAQKSINW